MKEEQERIDEQNKSAKEEVTLKEKEILRLQLERIEEGIKTNEKHVDDDVLKQERQVTGEQETRPNQVTEVTVADYV